MKAIKNLIIAICALIITAGCKNKNQTAPVESDQDSLTTAVIDSIIEETDTVPPPLHVTQQGNYYIMIYWEEIIDEKSQADTDPDINPEVIQRTKLQSQFRSNPAKYTNLLIGDQTYKVRFVDEVLEDPDGNQIYPGEIHSRDDIPSLCARFELADPKAKLPERAYSGIIVTDSYLNSHKQLPVVYEESYDTPLPADIVKQLEQRYGMKAQRSLRICTIGDGYTYGLLQFRDEYKNYKGERWSDDFKAALALDVLTDGKNIYTVEKIGSWVADGDCSWNADDGGEYCPTYINWAFEGSKGLELCYVHSAPESETIGMYYLVNDQLVEFSYAIYHTLIDEPTPLWKKDIAEMRRLYVAEDPGENRHVNLTKWAEIYLDSKSEWFWMRDSLEKNGAFIQRKDGKFKVFAVETPRMKPAIAEKNGTYYLKMSGSAGGPAMYTEIWALKNGQQTEHLTLLEIYGEIDECSLNKRQLSPEQAKAYLDQLPEFRQINAYFHEIDE